MNFFECFLSCSLNMNADISLDIERNNIKFTYKFYLSLIPLFHVNFKGIYKQASRHPMALHLLDMGKDLW